MNRRPIAFSIVSLLLGMLLLSSAAHILVSDFDITNSNNFGFLGILAAAGCTLLVAAIGTWRPRPWGYLAVASAVLSIVGLDGYTLITSRTITAYYVPDFVMVASGMLLLLEPKSKKVFFDASLRWWERARRYALEFTTFGQGEQSERHQVQIVNISHTGCLVRSSHSLEIGKVFHLEIEDDFKVSCVVVRKIQNNFGLNFEFKSWRERRRLKKFVNRAVVPQHMHVSEKNMSENTFDKAA